MKKKERRPFACVALALAASVIMAQAAFADYEVPKAQDIDTEAEMSLTVNFSIDGCAAAGARIGIFRVADVYTEGGAVFYTSLTGDYDYEGLTADESSEIAAQLSETAPQQELLQYSALTDSYGSVCFSDLEEGIYLVMLEESVYGEDGTEYVFEPFLACVPLASEEDGKYVWIYDVISYPKVSDCIYEDDENPETDDADSPWLWAFACTGALLYPGSVLLTEKGHIKRKRRKYKY